MAETFVIVHGWSDESSSFKKLAHFLSDNLGANIISINLGDWLSMNDDVTYQDLAEAMNRAWREHGLSTNKRTANVVVHSTGALIVREWMTTYYTAESVPIKRFLMLAPANFGSPLAHKGRSFIGRAVKGWGNDGFETGKNILKGLELASPYTWNLAHKDLFTDTAWYGAGKILATVLVGNKGYGGMRAIANEEGSDGTVRISTANLNSMKIRIELDVDQTPKNPTLMQSNGQIAFGILDGINHTTITLSEAKNINKENVLEKLILKSLSVTDNDFSMVGSSFPWQDEINVLVGDTAKTSPRMQNAVVRVGDNLGNKIDDYFVEFYRTARNDQAFEYELYTKFLDTVHTYCDDGSYRSLYLNIGELKRINKIEAMAIDELFVSISAQPVYLETTKKNQPVGYAPVDSGASGGLKLNQTQIEQFFQPHRTVLIDVVLTRALSGDVFKLTSA